MAKPSFSKPEFLQSPSGARLATRISPAGKKAKAIVHINHGMAEHCARYERFAKALNKAGFHVIAQDHRGHGETTAEQAPLGIFAPKDGLDKVLEDCRFVNSHARELWPDLPVVWFGHSMGSILGIAYAMRHSETLDAAAFWNSGVDGGVLLVVLRLILKTERMLKGSDVPSGLTQKLTFETWNKAFAPNRTEFDWLSRDEAEVDKYVDDPLCGFDVSTGLWLDLSGAIKQGANDRELANIRNDLPIYLVAGSEDPCTDKGKAMERLEARLNKTGVKDVTLTVYPDNRHETLNELNRDEATAAFIEWLGERV